MDGELPRWETLPEDSSATLVAAGKAPASRSPTKSTPGGGPIRPAVIAREILVVSDSEEERQRRVKARRVVLANINVNDLPVIEISDSEDEDASSASVVAQKGDSQVLPDTNGTSVRPTPKSARVLGTTPRARRIVVSSDSETEDENPRAVEGALPTTPAARRRRLPLDDDIIDLTESPDEAEPEPWGPRDAAPSVDTSVPGGETSRQKGKGASTSGGPAEEAENLIPLFLDDDSDDEEGGTAPDDPFALDDGSILELNEPRSTRKPIRRIPPSSRGNTASPFTPLRDAQTPGRAGGEGSSSEDEDALDPNKPHGAARPSPPLVSNARTAFPSPGPSKRTPGAEKGKTPRVTKKALQERELERRREYAAAFFKEINEVVFGGGIPEATELVWSKRLLTTAGRAHWKRDRDGKHHTSIQLAEKILDCDERIRNTLSHEMCHLACWIISDAPEEHHGSIFKGWAKKVMKKRPEVVITTRHDYEITHKYHWKCEDCSKVYGRHSKSIDPEEHACGVCRGRLVPQFTTRQRAPKTPKPSADSQNAATRSRDSPLVMPGAFPATPAASRQPTVEIRVALEVSDEDDSDIEILAHTFKGVQITGASED